MSVPSSHAAGAARLPLRVLVKGSSTVVYASWMGGPRSEVTYPRAMEAEILAAGLPVDVHVTALPAERIRTALRRWHLEVLPWSPDVVVLHYGHADLIHLFLPRWLERHANTLGKKRGPLRTPYRRLVLRPVWIGLAKLQTFADSHLPRRLVTRRARRVVADLEELVERVRWAHSPLVLIPNLHPMGAQYRRWFPSIDLRMERMNELVAALVARLDEPDVRVFDVRCHVLSLVAEGRDPVPDGSHFVPEVHRAVGRAMGREIVDWALRQDHLLLPDAGA